jgi:lon-related putative ATP-dependent protease
MEADMEKIITKPLGADQVLFSVSPVPAGPDRSANAATVIGQGRALSALQMGLGIPARGYNVFIMGAPGTGRRTALLKALDNYSFSKEQVQDITCVYNFARPLEPRILYFPAGQAGLFKQDLHDLIEEIKNLVNLQNDNETFSLQKHDVLASAEEAENKLLSDFEDEIKLAGFQIAQIQEGEDRATDLVPLHKGKPVSFDELQGLSTKGGIGPEEISRLREQYYVYMDKMKALFDELRFQRSQLNHRILDLRREMVTPSVSSHIEALQAKYPIESVHTWLDDLQKDILSHLFFFSSSRPSREGSERRRRSNPLTRYGMNILVDRSDCCSAPVYFENRPTIANLVGSIDLQGEHSEDARNAYLNIRPGSLLKANNGVLVITAEDIVEDPDVWQYLKRVLQTGSLEIQAVHGHFAAPVSIKPEAIQIRLKVVLMGEEMSYDILYQTDPDFQKLFKVCAEFDSTMDRTPETEELYTSFLTQYTQKQGLRPLREDGIAALIAYSVREASHREKLSTRFSLIADLLREADWWASNAGKDALDAESVRGALDARKYMHNLPESKIQTLMQSGDILVHVSGEAVGRANGLAVLDRGYYSYGIPVVVSSRVAPGDGGVINIEGESGLSGEIFDKAVLILSGYLRSMYARSFPLSVTASVCFEQSYTAIDGDSATAVQLCVIISALSGLPLRQDLAITGSVNQMGDIQPVGGVSEKVEGFHAICACKGLSGTQGVIIPERNLSNLILSNTVEEDIRAGRFHVYTVETIGQVLEIMIGREYGEMNAKGEFPTGSINRLVSDELRRMADIIHSYSA